MQGKKDILLAAFVVVCAFYVAQTATKAIANLAAFSASNGCGAC